MYPVDEQDQVKSLDDIPQSSIGAPVPVVLSDESVTVVGYYLENAPPDLDGASVRIAGMDPPGEPIALVRFSVCYASMFGPPNDEAFAGHPLASRGLEPYGAFVIENSSWLRRLERMNSVHHYHEPKKSWRRKHYILTFHDSTFECVADGYTIELHEGSINGVFPRMLNLLERNRT